MADYKERFLKKKPTKRDLEDHESELFPNENSENENEAEDFISLVQIFHSIGKPDWLQQNQPKARTNFNIINLSQHPNRELADGLAICTVKGTSFEGKRDACIEEALAIESGESTGEVELIHDKENIYDPNALAVVSKYSKRQLGFVPKAADVNATYIAAMQAGRLTGAYLIEAKHSRFKAQANAMLMLATGWKNA